MGLEFVHRPQAAVVVEDRRPWRAAGAGDVAGAGVDEGLFAGEPGERTSVDDYSAVGCCCVGFVGGGEVRFGPGGGSELLRRGFGGRAGFGGETGGDPRVEATVENGCVATEHAQHDDKAASGESTCVVVGDHDSVIADAECTHVGGECLGRGERVAALGGWQAVPGERVVEVDPDGAGDMSALVGSLAIATVEVPAHVGDNQVRGVEPGDDFRGDDRGDHVQHPASTFA